MSSSIKVISGLLSKIDNEKLIRSYTDIMQLENECKTSKNLYLVYNENEIHKIYFDIDLKETTYEGEWNFDFLKNDLLAEIKNQFHMNRISIAEAHKKDKISYRVIINDFKMKISEMKDYIKDNYKNDFKYNCIDLSVYNKNGKIRLPYCNKDGENRPFIIIKGEFKDFITCIVDNCELKTYEKQKPIENDNEINNDETKIIELVNLLSNNRGNEFQEWFSIGSALKSIDNDFDTLFNDFSKVRKNYKGIKDIKKHWLNFPTNSNGIGVLINMAKVDNPSKFKDWTKKWSKKTTSNNDYEELKQELEKRLFLIEQPIQYGWTNDNGDLVIYNTKRDIKDILKPYKIGKVDFFDKWLEDPTRRSYLRFDFVPNNNVPNIYNKFIGFKYDNNNICNMEKIEPFLNLIKTLLNNEEISINAFLDWIAWIRQRPHLKTEKAVVLYSDTQGVGKNTLTQFISKVIGYSTTINDIKDLTKNFNSHLSNKLIICGDEIKVKAREIRDELKNMITRTKMILEKKGVDQVEISDYSNYIFTTNNQNSFYIEPTDRRFILLQLSDTVMDMQTAKQLYKLMDDDETLQSFDTYLKNRSLPDKLECPNNNYKKVLISHSLPSYIQMVYKNHKRYAYDEEKFNAIETNKHRLMDLYNDSVSYAKQNGLEWSFTPDKMSKEFKKEFNTYFKKGREYNYYQFPSEEILLQELKAMRSELIIDLD
jgi:phage pi2 protein 07